MAVMAKWNDHKFEVSPSVIRSFTSLSFKGSSETEEKTSNGQKYVARKNGKPLEINLTVVLDRRLGSNVRKEATAWTEEARTGKKGYFYVHEKSSYYKLVPCELMLIDASVSEVEMTPTGRWVRANVQLTLKQCGNCDGEKANSGSSGGGGSGGGYSKSSVKSTSTTSRKTPSRWNLGTLVETSDGKIVRQAVKDIEQRADEARKAAAASKSLNLTGRTSKTPIRRPTS